MLLKLPRGGMPLSDAVPYAFRAKGSPPSIHGNNQSITEGTAERGVARLQGEGLEGLDNRHALQ